MLKLFTSGRIAATSSLAAAFDYLIDAFSISQGR
jgi:hypothetical protein